MQKVNQNNVRLLIPNKAAAVAARISETESLTSREALLKFYRSKIYGQLENESTKVWHYSPAQLWEIGFRRNMKRVRQKKNGPGHSILAPYTEIILNSWRNERKSAAAIARDLEAIGIKTSPQNVWKFIKVRSQSGLTTSTKLKAGTK